MASVLTGLEADLNERVNSMQSRPDSPWLDNHPTVAWCKAPHHKLEREFRFWGELGEILYFFRDQGLSLGTDEEKELRQVFAGQCDTFTQELDELLRHPVLKAAYKQSFLGHLRSARSSILKARDSIKEPPVDEHTPRPFHRGDPKNDTIIRRQFVTSVCHLGFELFGDMPSQLIDDLLESKSASATRLGLIPWTRLSDDSRARESRKYLAIAKRRALAAARAANWDTKALIEP